MTVLGRHDESVALSALDLVPYFDSALAVDIISAALRAEDRDDSVQTARNALEGLQSIGGVEPVRDLLAIPENIQTIVRSALVSPDRSFERVAARLFVSHTRSTMRAPLEAVVGLRGVQLLELCYGTISEEEQNDESVDSPTALLAHYLFAARGIGRLGDLAAAREILSRFMDSGSRLLAFLDGLDAWNSEQHAKSTTILRAITRERRGDVVEAICALLLGTYEADQFRWLSAASYIDQSLVTFELLGDSRGRSRALVTKGRVTAGSGQAEEDFSVIETSLEFFELAKSLARDLVPRLGAEAQQTLGQAEIGLSRSLRILGRFESAIDAANEALVIFEPRTEQWNAAYFNLIDVLRSSGRFSKELAAAGVPAEGMPPGGYVGVQIANALIALVSSSRGSGPPESLETIIDRREAIKRFLEESAPNSERALARAEYEMAMKETEKYVQSLVARLEILRDRGEESSATLEFKALTEEHRRLSNRIRQDHLRR